MNVPVDQAAPVKAGGEVSIHAPLDTVWSVLTQIDDWPSWQEDVSRARLQGPLMEGAAFRWKAGGIPFRSVVHTVVARRMFGWTGRTFGVSAVHNWWFDESDGTTIVRVEESLQGLLPRLLRGSFQRTLDLGIEKNLTELQAAAEARSRDV